MTTSQAAVLSCHILALPLLYIALPPAAGLPMALLPVWSRSTSTSGGVIELIDRLYPVTTPAFLFSATLQILSPPSLESEKLPGSRSVQWTPRMRVGLLAPSKSGAPALPWSLERLSMPGSAALALAVKRKEAA